MKRGKAIAIVIVAMLLLALIFLSSKYFPAEDIQKGPRGENQRMIDSTSGLEIIKASEFSEIFGDGVEGYGEVFEFR